MRSANSFAKLVMLLISPTRTAGHNSITGAVHSVRGEHLPTIDPVTPKPLLLSAAFSVSRHDGISLAEQVLR